MVASRSIGTDLLHLALLYSTEGSYAEGSYKEGVGQPGQSVAPEQRAAAQSDGSSLVQSPVTSVTHCQALASAYASGCAADSVPGQGAQQAQQQLSPNTQAHESQEEEAYSTQPSTDVAAWDPSLLLTLMMKMPTLAGSIPSAGSRNSSPQTTSKNADTVTDSASVNASFRSILHEALFGFRPVQTHGSPTPMQMVNSRLLAAQASLAGAAGTLRFLAPLVDMANHAPSLQEQPSTSYADTHCENVRYVCCQRLHVLTTYVYICVRRLVASTTQ